MDRGRLLVGTSGFAYKEWKGIFYPDGTTDRGMLAHYASRFASVEINYSFRRHPSEKTLTAWRASVPDGFRFALKAHQRITHTLRLRDAADAVAGFVKVLEPLGDRLGPILFQCPPSLGFDADRLGSFLDSLPAGRRYAMEFRHPSWVTARGVLADRGVAWCVAETDDAPASEVVASPFVYLRLRKEAYEDEELVAWARRIETALADGRDVYCYLKHEDKAAGPRFAERLLELIGTP